MQKVAAKHEKFGICTQKSQISFWRKAGLFSEIFLVATETLETLETKRDIWRHRETFGDKGRHWRHWETLETLETSGDIGDIGDNTVRQFFVHDTTVRDWNWVRKCD